MKRYKLYGLLLCLFALGVTGCGEKPVESEVAAETEFDRSEQQETVLQSEEIEKTEEILEEGKEETVIDEEAEKYREMLEASIMATGNNYRLKRVLEKARSGETVNIATIGGSVTEGALASTFHKGYAYLFKEAFEQTYGASVNFMNAGLSGTPSALGVMRYEKDVLDRLGTAPDLLVIEFAVNDWEECTKRRAYEGLIYRALSDNEDCAVILMYAVTSKNWNLQSDLAPVGAHYKVPMVSMLNAMKKTTLTSEEYFADEFHPTAKGHEVMRDCLMQLLQRVDEEEACEPLPIPEEPKLDRSFAHMKRVTEGAQGVTISKGSFDSQDKVIQKIHFDETDEFADNFMHTPDSGKKPLKVTLTCSKILLDYKTANDASFGEAVISVDGKEVTTVNGNLAGGWNNSNIILVLDDETQGKHTLEVRMKDDSADKKFTVLGIAYDEKM